MSKKYWTVAFASAEQDEIDPGSVAVRLRGKGQHTYTTYAMTRDGAEALYRLLRIAIDNAVEHRRPRQ